MASVTRDSALYAQIYTNKYLTENAYQLGGRAYPIAFQHTVVSGEAGGASAGVSDIVNLCVLPKDVMVVALDVASENVWASVGVTGTYSIGDSGQVDRYMKATKSYTAGPVGGPIATQGDLRGGKLDFSGQNYLTTADTIVQLFWLNANPTVGKVIKGVFWVIPAA